MNAIHRRAAKAQFISGMQRGQPWQEAARQAGLHISQATAYRLLQRVRLEGEAALLDRRHGHPSKVREPVQRWLEEYCRASPSCASRTVQTALYERFGVWVSIPHLNRVRAALGISRCSRSVGKNQPNPPSESPWQEGAGSLLLLAAASETGLCSLLEQALPTSEQAPPRLAQATPTTRRQSLLTLLFLPMVGLRRTCDLRGYTGEALALLIGRRRAYGYWWVERFLSQVARAGGDETLTDALARWTARLWQADKREPGTPPPAFYVDGHKKPVHRH